MAWRERGVTHLITNLGGGILQVRDQVRAVLRLLEASEDHLGARDVLLRVEEVLEQVLVAPSDACAKWQARRWIQSFRRWTEADRWRRG